MSAYDAGDHSGAPSRPFVPAASDGAANAAAITTTEQNTSARRKRPASPGVAVVLVAWLSAVGSVMCISWEAVSRVTGALSTGLCPK